MQGHYYSAHMIAISDQGYWNINPARAALHEFAEAIKQLLNRSRSSSHRSVRSCIDFVDHHALTLSR
jgi:hypothetical protein